MGVFGGDSEFLGISLLVIDILIVGVVRVLEESSVVDALRPDVLLDFVSILLESYWVGFEVAQSLVYKVHILGLFFVTLVQALLLLEENVPKQVLNLTPNLHHERGVFLFPRSLVLGVVSLLEGTRVHVLLLRSYQFILLSHY